MFVKCSAIKIWKQLLLKHLCPQTSPLQLESLNSTNALDTKSLSVTVVACAIQYEMTLMALSHQ